LNKTVVELHRKYENKINVKISIDLK